MCGGISGQEEGGWGDAGDVDVPASVCAGMQGLGAEGGRMCGCVRMRVGWVGGYMHVQERGNEERDPYACMCMQDEARQRAEGQKASTPKKSKRRKKGGSKAAGTAKDEL